MYYVIRLDDTDNESFDDLKRPVIVGFEGLRFDDGVFIKDELPLIVFARKSQKGKLLDFVPSYLDGILISEKFRNSLEQAGVDNVQFFPAVINETKTNIRHENYFVANVVGLLDCMDMENSEYETRAAFPDKVRSIDDLKLDYNNIHGEKIFRLKQWPSMVLIDESVKSLLEKNGLTGIKFMDAEGYWV